MTGRLGFVSLLPQCSARCPEFLRNLGVEPKIGGLKTPKMDGENNGTGDRTSTFYNKIRPTRDFPEHSSKDTKTYPHLANGP